jgi:2-amino-4-hydroxy-6-hydroxymethyldihydropteridine diphosphokinase
VSIKTTVVFIGIGSNLGNRYYNIRRAVQLLAAVKDVKIDKISSLIETMPQGGPRQGKYINGALKIITSLSAIGLLRILQEIENKLGRKRTVKNGSRTIDLDILLYGDKIVNQKNLQIPHPRMWERDFVTTPLREIAPEIFDRLENIVNCKISI